MRIEIESDWDSSGDGTGEYHELQLGPYEAKVHTVARSSLNEIKVAVLDNQTNLLFEASFYNGVATVDEIKRVAEDIIMRKHTGRPRPDNDLYNLTSIFDAANRNRER